VKFLDERLPDRFWEKLQPCPMSGCWLWTGASNGIGYGRINVAGRNVYAHRLAFETSNGPIAAGLVLDHRVCQTPSCCNPLHLEAVTQRTNVLRGSSPAARGARATTCPHGHPYNKENTYSSPSGDRRCRACHRVESTARYARRIA
jgi:hypothetical protein